MLETFKEIFKRPSIVVIIIGAILLVVGASGNITINDFSLALSEMAARLAVAIFGGLLVILGGYGVWREIVQLKTGNSGEFYLSTSEDTSQQSFRLEKHLSEARTIDLLGYNLKGMLQNLREPLAQAIINGAILRIILVDITGPTAHLFSEHSRRPHLLLSEWTAGLQHIADIREILSKSPKVAGRLEVKVTSWIPSSTLILINANDENGILKAGIHALSFQAFLSNKVSLVIKRKKNEKAFNFFVNGFDILWNNDSVVWDGRIPETQGDEV